MTVEKSILANERKGASSWIFRLDREQLRQVIAAMAAWVRTQGALRGRIVEIHLIETTEDEGSPDVVHPPGTV